MRYNLNGKTFKTKTAYLKEWVRVTDKLKEKLGPDTIIIGFDPGVQVVNKNEYTGSCSLPMWMVLKIIDEYVEPVAVEKPKYDYKTYNTFSPRVSG